MNKKYIIISITILIISISYLSGCVYKIPEDPNTFVRSMLHDGYNRTYRIHIPPDIKLCSSASVLNPPRVSVLSVFSPVPPPPWSTKTMEGESTSFISGGICIR